VDKKFIKIGLSLSTYLNIDVVGIDIIIDKSGQIYILEINVDPGIRLHMEPTYGPHYNVCDEILDYFFN
jgi:D-alanine-D-alanine ligase-like ATP-grasp enzyme